jgi:sec-independent protein translocase protein TatA
MGISIGQLIIILIIVALLFGTKKLRNIGGDLGSSIKSFRKAVRDGEDEGDARDDTPKQGTVIEGETKPAADKDQKPS